MIEQEALEMIQVGDHDICHRIDEWPIIDAFDRTLIPELEEVIIIKDGRAIPFHP